MPNIISNHITNSLKIFLIKSGFLFVMLLSSNYFYYNTPQQDKSLKLIYYTNYDKLNASLYFAELALHKRQEFHKSNPLCSKYRLQDFQRRFANISRTPDSNCSAPHVQIYNGGRLGNQVCQLMSLYMFRKYFGVRISITKDSQKYMDTILSNTSVPHGPSECFALVDKKKRSSFDDVFKNFNDSLYWIKRGEPLKSNKIKYFNNINPYPCQICAIILYRDEIRNALQIKPDLIKKAKQRMMNVAFAQKKLATSNRIHISVHVRRTDYINLLKKYNRRGFTDVKFYKKAFDLYRRRYKSVIFFIVSDDIKWCKRNLDDQDVIFLDGNTRNPALDYVTITQCHHHIVSQGTFGSSSALLGSGTIAYDIYSSFEGNVECWACGDPEMYIPVF